MQLHNQLKLSIFDGSFSSPRTCRSIPSQLHSNTIKMNFFFSSIFMFRCWPKDIPINFQFIRIFIPKCECKWKNELKATTSQQQQQQQNSTLNVAVDSNEICIKLKENKKYIESGVIIKSTDEALWRAAHRLCQQQQQNTNTKEKKTLVFNIEKHK